VAATVAGNGLHHGRGAKVPSAMKLGQSSCSRGRSR
jgi:hypothetical protein